MLTFCKVTDYAWYVTSVRPTRAGGSLPPTFPPFHQLPSSCFPLPISAQFSLLSLQQKLRMKITDGRELLPLLSRVDVYNSD